MNQLTSEVQKATEQHEEKKEGKARSDNSSRRRSNTRWTGGGLKGGNKKAKSMTVKQTSGKIKHKF